MKRAFLLFVSLGAGLAIAGAHSALQRTDPPDGAILRQTPHEIRFWFSEPIKVGLSTFEVRDGSGRQIDRRDLHADKTEPTLLHLSLGDGLGPGTYKVNWTAVAQDMHPSRGSLRFQVSPNEKR